MKSIRESVDERPWLGWVLFAGTVVIVFLVGLFGAGIVERRGETRCTCKVRPIPDWEPRNEVWGENIRVNSRPTSPPSTRASAASTPAPPPSTILADDPNTRDPLGRVRLLAGLQAGPRSLLRRRGYPQHAPNGIPQPATCWTCKSTDVPRVMSRWARPTTIRTRAAPGPGDRQQHRLPGLPRPEDHEPPHHPPRPRGGLPRQGRDITKATHQEMRSLVCAQCHVEYYFKGKEDKYLTFPWDKGFSVDEMEQYYDTAAMWTSSTS